jgi:MscS family membrane protein
MDFLDKIYFDNTVRSYLVVIGIILFVLVVKRYLSQYIVSLIYKLAKRFWKTLDKKSFLNLVVEPVKWFLAIVISVFAIDKLNFPAELDYEIYGHTTKDIFSRIGPGIIIASFIWLLLRLIDFIAIMLEQKANLTTDTRDNQLIVFFRDFFKVIIGIIGLLLIIRACFHQPIGNVLTGLSLVGAALALAAKESLENLIASFIIFFDKPFFTGDTIKVNAITGTVERIGLRSTRIRTADKTLVTVPNKQMVDSAVDNWSMRTERRAEIKLELSAGTPSPVLEKLLIEIKALLNKNAAAINASSVFIKELSKNGSAISVEYYTGPATLNEFFELKEKINLSIKKILEENQVEFAGESGSIFIKSENNTEG